MVRRYSRLAARIYAVAAAAVLAGMLACVRVDDVVQPAEISGGSTFEAAVRVSVDGDLTKEARGPVYGVMAISLPEGWRIAGIKPREGRGRFNAVSGEVFPPGVVRPGYVWHVFRTPVMDDASLFMGRAYDVDVKIKTDAKAGSYCLKYVAGAATGDDYDLRVEWGSQPENHVSRRMTLK